MAKRRAKKGGYIGGKKCVVVGARKQCAIRKKSGQLKFVKNSTPGCGCGGKRRKARKSR